MLPPKGKRGEILSGILKDNLKDITITVTGRTVMNLTVTGEAVISGVTGLGWRPVLTTGFMRNQ